MGKHVLSLVPRLLTWPQFLMVQFLRIY